MDVQTLTDSEFDQTLEVATQEHEEKLRRAEEDRLKRELADTERKEAEAKEDERRTAREKILTERLAVAQSEADEHEAARLAAEKKAAETQRELDRKLEELDRELNKPPPVEEPPPPRPAEKPKPLGDNVPGADKVVLTARALYDLDRPRNILIPLGARVQRDSANDGYWVTAELWVSSTALAEGGAL